MGAPGRGLGEEEAAAIGCWHWNRALVPASRTFVERLATRGRPEPCLSLSRKAPRAAPCLLAEGGVLGQLAL